MGGVGGQLFTYVIKKDTNIKKTNRKDWKLIIEPPHEKTNNLHMCNQRHRSASQ